MIRKTAFVLAALLGVGVAEKAASQIIDTVAGGDVHDGQPASQAALNHAYQLAITSTGELYIADSGYHRIRKFDPANGILTTVAGTGESGYTGDGGPATAARLRSPQGLILDPGGNLFIADSGNNVVRRLDRVSGTISTVAGTGAAGFAGDGGLAAQALLSSPWGLAVTANGDLLVGDSGNRRVRRVSGGIITTIAGTGVDASAGDGGPAAAASFRSVHSLLLLANGDLLVDDGNASVVRRIVAATGLITAFAGNGSFGFNNDSGQATAVALGYPVALARDLVGNVLIADFANSRLRRVSAGVITTVAGNSGIGASGDGGQAATAGIGIPGGVAVGPLGEIYIGDYLNGRVRVVNASTGVISRLVGPGATGDGASALRAFLPGPTGLAKGFGKLYASGSLAGRVRAVDLATGVISTVAGNGNNLGNAPADGTPATAAPIQPFGLALDPAGNLLVAAVSRVYKVAAGTGTISTVAGGGGGADGGPAATAALSSAVEVALDAAGNILIGEGGAHKIRRVSAANGTISTIAGNGGAGSAGDGGPATLASLRDPYGIAFDSAGNIYVADTGSNNVRRIDAATGFITTVAGSGAASDDGDGGPATAAGILSPKDVGVDANGDLLIAASRTIRRVSKATGLISTVSGSVLGFFGDGGPATLAQLSTAWAILVEPNGTITFADKDNDRVRAISCSVTTAPVLSLPPNGDTTTSGSVLLSWGAAPFAGRYDVPLDTVNPPARVVAHDVAGTSFTALGLTPSTTYYWSIVAKGDPACGASGGSAAAAVRSFRTPSACAELTDRQVCLGGERFVVKGTYRLEGGGSGALRFTKLTPDSAYFVFDNPSDAQALVKVLSVCFPPFNAHWVFVGALTDQEVNLTVTDTKTGAVKSYSNPLKTPFAPIQDTEAFKTCP